MKEKLQISTCMVVAAMCLLSSCAREEPQFTPTVVPVTSVSLSETSFEIVEGETQSLKEEISPYNATNQEVVWSSSSPDVANIEDIGYGYGLVTAIKEGTTTITVTTVDGNKEAHCTVTVKPKFHAVESVDLDKTKVKIKSNEPVTLIATVKPDNATDKTIIWSSSDESVATVKDGVVTAIKSGTTEITAKAGYISATCKVIVEYIQMPEAVDLGLSVKWASFNLGASKPEELGIYYQWAGIEGADLDIDDWEQCPYHGADYHTGWTKYVPSSSPESWSGSGNPDNKTVLDLEDDAAHVNLGGNWRIPTEEEWQELTDLSNCIWTWTQVNGVNVYKISSCKPGYSGKHIFLPGAGYCNNGRVKFIGDGYYWSSSLDTYFPEKAYTMEFDESPNGAWTWVKSERYNHLTIRPVEDK